jgi:hypothetical protein
MTSLHAQAPDAGYHPLESAAALAFVNDSSGAAAPPAPSHAFAALTHACPFYTCSHTFQAVTPDASTDGRVGSLRRPRLG